MKEQAVDLTAIRRDYKGEALSRARLEENPFLQFKQWFENAKEARSDDVSSMTLATANAVGMPSARIVLLKHYDESGFCWYTDYESQKGQDLLVNPQAEIMFYWYGLERQVRIQGAVHRLDEAQAQQYFEKRPRASQLSAMASRQSKAVASRDALERQVDELTELNTDVENMVRPERWGGFCLVPTQFEFWQGRESRLHDRFQYVRNGEQWEITRLQP